MNESLSDIYYPVVDQNKQQTKEEAVKHENFHRNVFRGFDFHFNPEIYNKVQLADKVYNKGSKGHTYNIIAPFYHKQAQWYVKSDLDNGCYHCDMSFLSPHDNSLRKDQAGNDKQ